MIVSFERLIHFGIWGGIGRVVVCSRLRLAVWCFHLPVDRLLPCLLLHRKFVRFPTVEVMLRSLVAIPVVRPSKPLATVRGAAHEGLDVPVEGEEVVRVRLHRVAVERFLALGAHDRAHATLAAVPVHEAQCATRPAQLAQSPHGLDVDFVRPVLEMSDAVLRFRA